jgi:hypothetical protein
MIGGEAVAIILPEGLDPAEWVLRNGTSGLDVFTLPGCLSHTGRGVRAAPAGAIMAHGMSGSDEDTEG